LSRERVKSKKQRFESCVPSSLRSKVSHKVTSLYMQIQKTQSDSHERPTREASESETKRKGRFASLVSVAFPRERLLILTLVSRQLDMIVLYNSFAFTSPSTFLSNLMQKRSLLPLVSLPILPSRELYDKDCVTSVRHTKLIDAANLRRTSINLMRFEDLANRQTSLFIDSKRSQFNCPHIEDQ